SALQASALIKFAAERTIPVVPCGSGTSQGIGHPPPAGALWLSSRRLNSGFHHDPPDMVATAPAGMEFGAFQEALGQNGQWLPLDGNPRATCGGLVATDSSGPRALGYGTFRDMVLGMTVINGDGVIRKCGGKVVKNVTGYALEKLYIGSLGTLGLIVEVTFKLRPLPLARRAWTLDAQNFRDGVAKLHALPALNLPLEALICNAVLSPQGPVGLIVIVSATGNAAELERIDRELAAALAPAGVKSAERRVAWDDGAVEQRTKAGGTPALPDAGGTPAVQLRFWCASAQMEAALEQVRSAATAGHVSFGTNWGVAELSLSEEQAARISAGLAQLGANFRWEDARGLKIALPFGPPRPEWALMKQLKAALDPKNIMNPGRFVV
ncbi:MAG: FAD-binding oxidoreductase, partial [Planctomycetota bacterium]